MNANNFLEDSYSSNLMMDDVSLRLPDLDSSYGRVSLRTPSESCNGFYNNNTDLKSNKKMGHTSFTDLGLYTKNCQRNNRKITDEDLAQARNQFMKLRFQRLQKTTCLPSSILEHSEEDEDESSQRMNERLNQSDSALCCLRKDSSRDTTELGGLWYKAKHPRHQSLEKLVHSAPDLRLAGLKEEQEEDTTESETSSS